MPDEEKDMGYVDQILDVVFKAQKLAASEGTNIVEVRHFVQGLVGDDNVMEALRRAGRVALPVAEPKEPVKPLQPGERLVLTVRDPIVSHGSPRLQRVLAPLTRGIDRASLFKELMRRAVRESPDEVSSALSELDIDVESVEQAIDQAYRSA